MKVRIFGINITVSFLFCAILSILLLCDRTGMVFPMFLAVLIHELAHLLLMKYFGCAPNEIRLIPGSVRIVSPVCADKQSVVISLAGPVANIVVFVVVYCSSLAIDVDYYLDFAFINLIYGIFNLLPFYALDGGSILEELIGVKTGVLKAQKIVKSVTMVGALVFFAFFVLLTLKGSVNYSVLVLSLYLILSVFIKL